MPKKPRKRASPNQRDPTWRMRRALGHKVETNPKAYTRKRKLPLEAAFAEGLHDLRDIVRRLNETNVRTADGRAWTEPLFAAEMKRLAEL